MDHPEICGKHKFNDARTRTKDAIDRQTQLRNTCDVTDEDEISQDQYQFFKGGFASRLME